MKELLVEKLSWIGLCIWIVAILAVSPVTAASLITIDGTQLEGLMADDRRLVIVDVREPDLFAAGHIRNAINIPYDEATRTYPPKTVPLLFGKFQHLDS